MKHPREWTDTERERFRQRHEAMCKELQIEKTKQNEKYTPVIKNIDGKALHFLSKVLLHKMTNAAERIVEKYRNVRWLDDEQVKMVVCNKAKQCKSILVCTAREPSSYKFTIGERFQSPDCVKGAKCIEVKG